MVVTLVRISSLIALLALSSAALADDLLPKSRAEALAMEARTPPPPASC
jgi:hypothetical protein